jgi:hypothetical protein
MKNITNLNQLKDYWLVVQKRINWLMCYSENANDSLERKHHAVYLSLLYIKRLEELDYLAQKLIRHM